MGECVISINGFELKDKTAREEVNALIVKADELEQRLNIVESADIVLISDSYGHPESSGGTSWEQYVTQYMSDKTVLPYYHGGAGFAWWGSDMHGKEHEHYFPKVVSQIPGSERTKDVLILAGANDGNLLNMGYTTAQIETGISETAEILRAKFPNAKISLGFVGRHKVFDAARDKAYYTACEAYKRCTKYGMCFADGFQYVLHNRDTITDSDVHPNAEGSARIAYYAVEYLRSGHLNVQDINLATVRGMNSILTVNNGITTLQMHANVSGISININKTLAFNNVVELGNFEIPGFKVTGSYGAIGGTGVLYASYTGGAGGTLSGFYYMVGSTLYFHILDVPQAKECLAVFMTHFEISAPTMFC